jgi:hypothetical protein
MPRVSLLAAMLVGASAALAALASAAMPAAASSPAAPSRYTYTHAVVTRAGKPCANLRVNAINDHGVSAGTVYCAQRSRGFISNRRSTFAFPAGPKSDTFVTAISDTGTLVGTSGINYSGRSTAWLRTPSGKYRKINDPHAGHYGTVPQEINKHNVIVGVYYTGTAANYHQRGYIDRAGHFSDVTLPSALKATDSAVTGINGRGDLCGWYVQASGPFHGFVIIGGRVHTVNAPAAGTARGQGTSVSSIADDGTYAGTAQYARFPDNAHQYRPYVHGWVFHHGRYTPIAVPKTYGNNTEILGMNDAGIIVGSYVHRDGRNGWDAEGFFAKPQK